MTFEISLNISSSPSKNGWSRKFLRGTHNEFPKYLNLNSCRWCQTSSNQAPKKNDPLVDSKKKKKTTSNKEDLFLGSTYAFPHSKSFIGSSSGQSQLSAPIPACPHRHSQNLGASRPSSTTLNAINFPSLSFCFPALFGDRKKFPSWGKPSSRPDKSHLWGKMLPKPPEVESLMLFWVFTLSAFLMSSGWSMILTIITSFP